MGGTQGVMCPTVDLGSLPFPWTKSVTSSNPTSGWEDESSRCRAAPGTVMAAPATMSRDRSFAGDWRKTTTATTDDDTRRVRSCDDVRRPDAAAAVTSQPEPDVVKPEVVVTTTSSDAGRRRFRDVALTIVSQIFELDGQEPSANDDVTVPVLTSTKIPYLSTSYGAAAECSARSNARRAGRGLLLEELLKARAREDKVSNRTV